MPNVTWQEPQVLIDLLAMNLLARQNNMELPPPQEIAVVSPWLSDVEIFMHPGAWHQQLTVGDADDPCTLGSVLDAFRLAGWAVHVAVLAYGRNPSGLTKDPNQFQAERTLLRRLVSHGVLVYLVPDLHAKGVITPLGIITGSTNMTRSGMFAQSQNANYFPRNHPDYSGNRVALMANFDRVTPAGVIN